MLQQLLEVLLVVCSSPCEVALFKTAFLLTLGWGVGVQIGELVAGSKFDMEFRSLSVHDTVG